ncbi:MAG: hypothetical protein U9O89_07110 [Thermoproteota archaeon]|nr:hypothetical protein [Thermoproteota archaeon]
MQILNDAVDLFINTVRNLEAEKVSLTSDLKRIALSGSFDRFAYMDNRKKAREYGYDLWAPIRKRFRDERSFINWVKSMGISKIFFILILGYFQISCLK